MSFGPHVRSRWVRSGVVVVAISIASASTPSAFELGRIGGHPYRWHEKNVPYYINPAGYPLADVDPDFEYVQQAFAAWAEAIGPDAPDFVLVHANATWGRDSQDGLNTIVFGDPDLPSDQYAQTTPWIDPGDTMDVNGLSLARLIDADIVFREEANLGPSCWRWGTPEEATGLDCELSRACVPPFAPSVDLYGTLVHEVGHFLGLGHEQDIPGVTMRARSWLEATCDSTFASLETDDVEGAALLYVDRFVPGAANVRLTVDPAGSTRPRVAFDPDGNVAVVWQDSRYGSWEILWQKFTSCGIPITPVVRLTDTPEDCFRPDIDIDAGGTSHVVWQKDSNLSGVGEVFLCRLDPAGSKILDDLLVDGASGDPRVSALDGGATDLTWRHFETSDQRVYTRRYDVAGAQTCERSFGGTLPGFEKRPVIATRQSDGRAIVHWLDLSTSFQYQIREAMVNSSCSVVVAEHNIMQHADPMCPSIAHNGSFLFMMFERNGNIRNYQGTNSSCQISQGSGTSSCPSIDADASNGYATWADTRDGNSEIYFCRFWGCTNRTGDVRLTADPAASLSPDIAVDPSGSGDWAVVWQDARDGNTEIYLASPRVAVGVEETSVVSREIGGLHLAQNVPNPFGGGTRIGYVMPRAGHAVLRVYDVRGRLVATVLDGIRSAGRHEATWDGRDGEGAAVASGIYFYRFTTAGQERTRKMVVMR